LPQLEQRFSEIWILDDDFRQLLSFVSAEIIGVRLQRLLDVDHKLEARIGGLNINTWDASFEADLWNAINIHTSVRKQLIITLSAWHPRALYLTRWPLSLDRLEV
jgi:hypothetical protein